MMRKEKHGSGDIRVREINLGQIPDSPDSTRTDTGTGDRADMGIPTGTGDQVDMGIPTGTEDPADGSKRASKSKKKFFGSRKKHTERPAYNPVRRGSANRNTELVIVTWIFSAIFLLMVGYLVWFTVFKREEIDSNVYNTKQDSASDRIIRGDIVAEDGTQLAYSTIDYTGNETRIYPYYNMYAHVIGYATNGKSGIEATYNNLMMQSHSSLLNQLQNAESSEKEQGDTLVVTLNPTLQSAAYYALGSYRGAIVVMEPDSGKVLAMVSKPDFDPNEIDSEWDQLVGDNSNSALLNRATQGLYPPGSTFKILTALSYLREHDEDYSSFDYTCTGSLTQDDVTITCYGGEAHGQETLSDAFAYSCNTAFATIGLGLDNRQFRSLAEDFLFNRSLPIDLPSSESVFRLEKNSSYGDQMTTAIGQGDTLVTPLHMAMITSAVANAGTMMKPYFVSKVVSSDGNTVSQTKPEIYLDAMTVEEAQILTSFMKGTVSYGTASALSYNSYSVAGKTGSAEYETDNGTGTHSWFVGFSNVDDPDIAVAIIVEDGGTGSSTAVPIAQQIFDAYYAAY